MVLWMGAMVVFLMRNYWRVLEVQFGRLVYRSGSSKAARSYRATNEAGSHMKRFHRKFGLFTMFNRISLSGFKVAHLHDTTTCSLGSRCCYVYTCVWNVKNSCGSFGMDPILGFVMFELAFGCRGHSFKSFKCVFGWIFPCFFLLDLVEGTNLHKLISPTMRFLYSRMSSSVGSTSMMVLSN